MPDEIQIPAINVSSSMLHLGLNNDDTLEVPPYREDDEAGWYRHSPTPGEVGPAVIVGHVASTAHGPGVFYRAGDLRPGDEIRVGRRDQTTAVFTVDRVTSVDKDQFPTGAVYGDIDHPGLRLITCGGSYTEGTGDYTDNVVVYASLTDTET